MIRRLSEARVSPCQLRFLLECVVAVIPIPGALAAALSLSLVIGCLHKGREIGHGNFVVPASPASRSSPAPLSQYGGSPVTYQKKNRDGWEKRFTPKPQSTAGATEYWCRIQKRALSISEVVGSSECPKFSRLRLREVTSSAVHLLTSSS